MKRMTGVRRIPVPIYGGELVVFHCAHEDLRAHAVGDDVVAAEVERWGDGPFSGACEVLRSDDSKDDVRWVLLVFVEADQSLRDKRLTAVHEATHLAVRLFAKIEQSVVPEADEPFAYLTEWLTKELWRSFGG